jgi:prepilin-type N-terminal cleavage/methylation domain-containing protein
MSKQRGFSLIELLVVVTIIMVISALAIPNLLRSRMAANEASAVSSLHTIAGAEVSYAALYASGGGVGGYSNDLASLGGTSCSSPTATSSCMIDNDLASATSGSTAKSGFYFTYSLSSTWGFTLNADPTTFGSTGSRHFYIDATHVIRYTTTNRPATASDSSLQ